MCAGPYSQGLLGMDDRLSQEYEDILSEPRLVTNYNHTILSKTHSFLLIKSYKNAWSGQ
jgi:hypothetical protein